MEVGTINWIILGVITFANIGLAWCSSNYAKIAQDACKRALKIEKSDVESDN